MITTPGQLSRRAQLYHQLGSMIGAGVPLLQALDMASRHPEMRSSRNTVHDLIQSMQSGKTFTESMSHSQGWIPEFDVALLSVGEQTGRLDQAFVLLASYYASRATIIRDTISDLITTTATLHVFLLVFPLRFLVQCARGIFTNDYAMCVPFLIQKAIVFGSLYLTVFFLAFASQGQRGESWRALVEGIFGVVPILRTARKYLTLSRLAAALQASVSSGVSIITGWDLAGAASGSPHIRRMISAWKPYLESGSTPGEMINESGYFPEMFSNYYQTGEQSGSLDDALKRLQAYYQDEGFRRLRFFTRVMNGTIYGLIVMLIGYNIIQFYMGYYANIFNSVDAP